MKHNFKIGDLIKVFDGNKERNDYIGLGLIKANFGHDMDNCFEILLFKKPDKKYGISNYICFRFPFEMELIQ